MNALASLATTALLGTERRPPEWPAAEGALGELLARIPRESVETALLQTAGVLGTCHLAGLLPARNDAPMTPASEDQTTPDLRVELLASILTEGPERLIAEAFQKIVAIPHRLLPKALDCGRRSTAIRPLLLPVLGNRGHWLAAQNEVWAYAIGTASQSDDVWNLGSLDQRVRFLTTLRGTDATQARELVVAAMSTEGAKERTAFIECLTMGLTLADQDLLEITLADKSKEARQTAARLLSSLADSRFAQRMSARLQLLLKSEKKLLRGTVFTLEAPAGYDAEWKSDLIEEAKPKGHALGDRAWWLYQLVRQTPLTWWETQTGMKPADLLGWAQKSDWKDALVLGWAEAQAVQRRVEWAEAFLGTSLPPQGPLTVFDLLETLPFAAREPHFLRLLMETDAKTTATSHLIDRFIKAMPLTAPMLTQPTAQKAIQFLKKRIYSGDARYDWQLRSSLVEFACIVPRTAFDEFANGWELTKEEAQPFAESISRLGIVLDQRKQLLTP